MQNMDGKEYVAKLKRTNEEQSVKGLGACSDVVMLLSLCKYETDSCMFKFLMLQTKYP